MIVRYFVLPAALLVSMQQATAATVEGTVERMFTDYPNFGWCMAKINITSGSTVCPAFLSLGCDGQYVPKAVANNNFSTIQLAYVTGATVSLGVREDLRYNVDYCFVQRVDILQQQP